MKLLYLSNSIIPSKNANSVHVMKMSQAFSKLDISVTLVTPNISAENNYGDVYESYGVKNSFTIKRLPYPKLLPGRVKFWFYVIASFFYALKNKGAYIYGRNVGACCLIALFKKGVAVELHSPLIKLGFFERALLRAALKFSSNFSITVISKALRDILISEGVQDRFIYVNHDGADIPTSISENKKSSFKAGYVGHLYPGRGIEIIIYLAKNLPEVLFEVVGGLDKDIKYWRTKGVPNNLVFIGHVTPNEAESFRLGCDILLAPYQNKVSVGGKGDTSTYMSPLKIFEYMAAGKVIISSDLPVLKEVLNSDNSILVDPNNYKAWADAVRYIHKNPDFSASLAEKSKLDLINKYTWQKRAENILERLSR